MNYRHAFHAGNFADVMKHAILALVVDHLRLKPAPFRIIDTHAGAGRYALDSDPASRTGEWRHGIGRLLEGKLPGDVAPLLASYLSAVRDANTGAAEEMPRIYPGSPLVARSLMCRNDSLVVNELHPSDHADLTRLFSGDPQTKVMALDAWTALRSLLPPKERRGAVLIDPPFEEAGEFHRMADGLADGLRRFGTGIFLLWYPIKDPKRIRPFRSRINELGIDKLAVAELLIRKPVNSDLLNGCGMVIVNPPYRLTEKLGVLLPYLADRLAAGAGAEGYCESIGNTAA